MKTGHTITIRLLLFLISSPCVAVAIGCLPADSLHPASESSIEIWGRAGFDDGRFVKPRAITIDQNDNVYVVDMTSRIQVFDRQGNFQRSWRTPVWENGKPVGLAISQDNLLIVSDTHYFRILFYTLEGQLLEELTIGGQNGRGPGEFGFTTGVAQDSRGNFYVAEYGDFDRIQKFCPAGNYLDQWGGHGTEPGQFLRPQSIAMDQNDHLWVADSSNHRIQVFDVSKEPISLIRVWGNQGTAHGELNYPYAIWLDEANQRVWICDMCNHRLQAFTHEGQFLLAWGGPGRQPGQFYQPWDFCRDSQDFFLVLDTYNHRLQKFQIPEDSFD